MLDSNQVQPVISSVVTPVALEGFKTPLLNEYPGAAAAYSLRRLKSWDDGKRVVRVRRASDNSEKDFSAEDISSGAMTGWVNAQIVPPLDIRELDSNGERTGDVVEATAAYSLRNLSSSYTGNVVDVRRSSDNAEESFTAAEVADGTLTDWVNTTNGVFANTGYESFSGASASGFTASNSSSTGFAVSDIPDGVSGDIVKVSFDITITSGSPGISLREVLGGSGTSSSSDLPGGSITSSGSYTVTLTANNNYVGVGFTEGDSPSEFTVSNFKILGNGFVSKWYDQSGNNNDAIATAEASQPKIVDGGSLVYDGIDFDGSDDFFEVTPISTSSAALSIFIFGDAQPNLFAYPIGNNNNAGIGVSSTQFRYNLISGTPILENWSSTLSGQNLYTFIHDGTTDVPNTSGYRNGTIGSQTSASQGDPPDDSIRYIGTRNQVQEFNGVIGELIIYTSDQSDNRTAIESNIGDHYDIDLPSGVDTGYDQVDGFVETWYDQSGNGNDAAQQVSGYQPKIVDAGVLVTDRDGKIALNGKSARLDMPSNAPMLSSDGTYSLFAAVDFDDQRNGNNTFNNIIGFTSKTDGGASGFRKPLVYAGQNDGKLRISSPSQPSGSASLTFLETVGVQLLTNIANPALPTGNNTAYVDGVLVSSVNSNTDVNTETLTGNNNTRLFDLQETTVETFLSEVIYYPSDQSDNRAGIEDNINNQYDIY